MTNKKILKQLMVVPSIEQDPNSYKPISKIIRTVISDVCLDQFSHKLAPEMYSSYPQKGFSEIQLPVSAISFVRKLVDMYGTVFFVSYNDDNNTIVVSHRVHTQPNDAFMVAYGKMFEELTAYKLPDESPLPVKEFAFPDSFVYDPEVNESLAYLKESNDTGDADEVSVPIQTNANDGNADQKEVVGNMNSPQFVVRQEINVDTASLGLPQELVSFDTEKKKLFAERDIKWKNHILYDAFRGLGIEFRKFPVGSLNRPGLVMYLSLEDNTKLAAYLGLIGLQYEIPKESKKIILVTSNVPEYVDPELSRIIDEKLNVQKQKQVKQPRTSKNHTEFFPSEQLKQLSDMIPLMLKIFGDIPQKTKEFEELMKRFEVGVESAEMIDDRVNLRMKAKMEQSAKFIATAVADHVINGNEQIIFLKKNVNTFTKENFVSWIEEGLKKSLTTICVPKKSV